MKQLSTFLISLLALFVSSGTSAQQDSIYSSPVSLLSRYVQIESISGGENEAAYFISKVCRDMGLIVEYITDSPGKVNFSASLYPLSDNRPNIVFHTHMDVVPEGDIKDWSYPPFGGVIDQGRVWGRGAMDNKGLGVIELFAAKNFIDKALKEDLPYNVTILFVSGEEIGGVTGSAIIAKNFIEQFNPKVLIGEGGAGSSTILGSITKGRPVFGISIAEKENLMLKLSWEGSATGHASLADDSNAIVSMIKDLNRLVKASAPITVTPESALMIKSLGEVIGGFKGRLLKHPDSPLFQRALKLLSKKNPVVNDLFTNKITLASFAVSSTALNQNSITESAYLDTRVLPGVHSSVVIDFVAKSIKNPEVKIEPITKIVNCSGTEPEEFYDIMSTAIKMEYKDAEVIPLLFTASTDNNFYRSTGIPVYGISPMIVSDEQLNAIHSFDEFIKIEDLERGIKVFTTFIGSIQERGLF